MSIFSLPQKNQAVSLSKIKEICEHYSLLDLWEIVLNDPPDRPFVSDGVSCFPDKIGRVDLYPAALPHDLKYWAGYSGDRGGRFVADCELAIDVVIRCRGSAWLALAMLIGVRIGGARWLPTSWRWTFGRVKQS